MNLVEGLQIEETCLTPKGYRSVMKLSKFHEQPFGFVNGGAIIAFAEISAGQASNLLCDGQGHAVGQTVSANHMYPCKAVGILTADAELLHKGKRSHVWSIQMVDEEKKLISQVMVTNAIINTLRKNADSVG